MSGLDGDFGARVVTDLDELQRCRRDFYEMGYEMPLQDEEREAGLTEADIWKFLDEPVEMA